MAYIGRDISNLSDRVVLDNITASATATYNLLLNSVAYVPSSAESLTVSLNGVIQKPQSSYTVSGSTIVFDSALTSSDSIDFILAERAITLTTVGSGSVGTSQIVDGSVSNSKLANSSITLNGSAVSLGGSATIGGGKIGQVVQTIKSNTETSSSTSYVTVSSVTITPSATDSKVLLMFHPRVGCNTGSANVFLKIRNNTAAADVQANPFIVTRWPSDGQSAYYTQPQPMVYLDSPSTTSATQYLLQMKTNAGAWTLNMPANTGGYSDVEVSTLIAMEVLA